MKTKLTTKILLSICILCMYLSFPANAEEIDLSGRVIDEQSEPLSGVKVYLETANMTAYTDASGYFNFFVQNNPTAIELTTANSERISFDGNRLLLNCENQHIIVDMYDITGKYVKRLLDEDNLSGIYALYPKAYLENEPQSIYLVRAILDGELFGYKVSKMNGTVFSQGLHAAEKSAATVPSINMKSTQAVDQLIFTHNSYKTKQVPVDNYVANIGNVTMESKVINAPVLSGPSTTYSLYELNWSYNWTGNQSGDDHYELEYSYQPNSGFQVLIYYPDGDRTSPYSESLFPEAQDVGKTTYFRVRAKSGGVYSEYSNTIGVYCPMLEMTSIAAYDNPMMKQSNNSAVENTNYKTSNLAVGVWYQYNLGGFTEYAITNSALYFDIMNFIEGRTIQSAILKLHVISIPGDMNTDYKVRALAGSWNTNTITYNNTPARYTSYVAVEDPPYTNAIPWEVDITSIVQAWANGSIPNYGVILEDNHIVWPGYTAIRISYFHSLETAPNNGYKPQLYLEIK
jgi:hypothetical protein